MKGLSALLGLPLRARPPVGTTPADAVFSENKWRLLRYRPRDAGPALRTPVLMVPSLINRHYVLDLLPGKSFAEWMVAAGHDVYCIDWGTPGDEDRFVTFDDVADRWLGRALRQVERASGAPPHVLGYCLGGTLASIHAAAHKSRMSSLALLAAPVRFSDPGLLTAWTRTRSFDVRALVDAWGNVPWPLMQSAFQLLRPTLNLAKLVSLLDRAWNDEFLDGFLALEAWGNDNVSFPGECYVTYLEELYRKDALWQGAFRLGGRPARLETIDCPTLAVTFEHDTIVPWQSAACLLERVATADKHHLHLPGGHVGAVVSRAAARGLWPAISKFWADRDAKPAPAARPAPAAKPAPAAPAARKRPRPRARP